MDTEFGMVAHVYCTGRGGGEREKDRGGEGGVKERWREGERVRDGEGEGGEWGRERGERGRRGEREGEGGARALTNRQSLSRVPASQARYRINQTYTSLPQLSEHVHTVTPHTSERALQVCNERHRTQNK